jgi:predicted amidophosphoribosyltransferase
VRYGIDPTAVLVSELSRLTAIPIVKGLRAGMFAAQHAGSSRQDRTVPRFTSVRGVPNGAVLVDDVVTTASTLESAARELGPQVVIGAVTATVSV